MLIMSNTPDYATRRKNFMESFNSDITLTKTIPEITAQLFYDEFGVNIFDHSHIPIVFTIGWTEILKFVGGQEADEFSIDVGGILLEYVTEYSESDKATNIVPQLIHKRAPIFTKQQNQTVPGSSYNEELLSKYNSWRSVNLTETLDKIERDIYAIALNDYGINLMVSATIFPLMAATYAAGLQLAKETKTAVNMYNIFEIEIVNGDVILLTPLSTIKQYLKDDSKRAKRK